MDGFGGLLAVLAVIIGAINMISKANKVKTNAPGRRGSAPPPRPAPGADPARERAAQPYVPARPIVTPPAAPPASPEAAASPAPLPDGLLDESDRARGDLSEGDSRECDHGSVGGSMDITSHMGMGEAIEPAAPLVRDSRPRVDSSAAARPIAALNAEEMRRAVIMAEILKRPAERFAGRRWVAR